MAFWLCNFAKLYTLTTRLGVPFFVASSTLLTFSFSVDSPLAQQLLSPKQECTTPEPPAASEARLSPPPPKTTTPPPPPPPRAPPPNLRAPPPGGPPFPGGARRRATSQSQDPAEQLTEMSVRGLNLFRYASISEGVYQCTECAKVDVQKTFKNKYSFQRHAFLYHEGHQRKVFPCPVCQKEFSRPDKMKNHMKTVHDCFMPKDVVFPPMGFFPIP